MEIANSENGNIRPATEADRGEIFRLIQNAPYRHFHADWYFPADWLGKPGFVVCESGDRQNLVRRLLGLLAATADPAPAAWVRLVALSGGNDPQVMLKSLMAAVQPTLRAVGVTQLGWLPTLFWPSKWFIDLGFKQVNHIITFVKEDMRLPVFPDRGIEIRQAIMEDMPALAAIEADAFEPLWRHSVEGLSLAFKQAQSFDIAVFDDQIGGFQYSVQGHSPDSVHLVRITVAPSLQGRGLGSALMATAINRCRQSGIRQVTLNTQIDNYSSHRLYKRFGFERLGDELPVWSMWL